MKDTILAVKNKPYENSTIVVFGGCGSSCQVGTGKCGNGGGGGGTRGKQPLLFSIYVVNQLKEKFNPKYAELSPRLETILEPLFFAFYS